MESKGICRRWKNVNTRRGRKLDRRSGIRDGDRADARENGDRAVFAPNENEAGVCGIGKVRTHRRSTDTQEMKKQG